MAHTTSIIVMTLGTGEVILVVVVVMVMFWLACKVGANKGAAATQKAIAWIEDQRGRTMVRTGINASSNIQRNTNNPPQALMP